MTDDKSRKCPCCGATLGGDPSEDPITEVRRRETNDALCSNCKARGRERVGVEYDLAELGGEATPKPTFDSSTSNARSAKAARLASQRAVDTGSPDQPATESLANHRDESADAEGRRREVGKILHGWLTRETS